MRGGIPLHLDHLAEPARQSGHWSLDKPFTARTLQALLAGRIGRLDVASARLDIERFIAHSEPLAIWSQDYFQQLVQRVVMDTQHFRCGCSKSRWRVPPGLGEVGGNGDGEPTFYRL